MSDAAADDEERLLRMELMRADIELKNSRAKWEPWKAMAAAFTAGAAMFGAIFGLIGLAVGYVAGHR